jgi:hypothetical protein
MRSFATKGSIKLRIRIEEAMPSKHEKPSTITLYIEEAYIDFKDYRQV